MAMTYGDSTYGNALRRMVQTPGSYQGSPGFQFALNTGLDATARGSAAGGMRGSGNALAALTKYGTGLAQQDYGAQMDRLTRAAGQEENYDVGQTGNANTLDLGRERTAADLSLGHERNANDLTLGEGQLGLGFGRLGLDAELGRGNLALGGGRLALDRDLGEGRLGLDRDLGMGRLALDTTAEGHNYDINTGRNANDAQRNMFDFTSNMTRNSNDAARDQNDFNYRMFDANTTRGNALANIYFRRQAQQPHTFNTPGGLVTTTPRFG